MNVAKEILYDWIGGNEFVFHAVNSLSTNSSYIKAMKMITLIGDKHLFVPYLIATLVAALIAIGLRKLAKKPGNEFYTARWAGVLIMMIIGFIVSTAVIHVLKEFYAYPRPYVVFGETGVNLYESRPSNVDHRSFPSGHVAFITFVIFAIWPVLNYHMRWLGMALIAAVAWSRMALGVHFPADVFYSWVIVMFLIGILRVVVYSILGRFNLRC